MKEKLKQLKPIQKMMVFTLLVLLSILTTQTSAIAQPLTRAQMAVILGQGIHGSNFTPPVATGIFNDVPLDHGAADWIEQFYKDGITSGCGQNPLRYCPTSPVSRAEIAIFLLRSKYGKNYKPPKATGIFDDVPITHWAADWIEQLYSEKITSGCSANQLKYCPDSSVTAVQAAIFTARTFGGPPGAVPKTGGTWGGDERGVEWPEPRFTDNSDGTVIDHLTGLIWLKNANCFGERNWFEAMDDSDSLADGQCGLTDGSRPGDWFLPNIKELHSLMVYGCMRIGVCGEQGMLPEGHPFIAVPDYTMNQNYWTSTGTVTGVDDRYHAFGVRVFIADIGEILGDDTTNTIDTIDGECLDWDSCHDHWDGPLYFMWPVRGGNR